MKRIHKLLLILVGLLVALYAVLRCSLIIAPTVMNREFVPLGMYSGNPGTTPHHQGVRMECQDVSIRLEKNTYFVDGVFHFFNPAETRIQWIGFPKFGSTWGGKSRSAPDFIRFNAWVNGKKLELSEHRHVIRDTIFLWTALFSKPPSDADYHGCLSSHVRFPGAKRTTIRVSYSAHYLRLMGGLVAPYIVGSSSSWEGSIGRAVFTIDGAGIGGTDRIKLYFYAVPAVTKITKNAVRIEITGYQPSDGKELKVCVLRRPPKAGKSILGIGESFIVK
jgi:hypothetical protein